MDCIFCKIIKGEVGSNKVYENENVLALLDVNPISTGHTLIIPKKHFNDIFDIDEDYLKEIIVAAKLISKKTKDNLGAVGINLLQSNGSKAGQVIFHFHLHVIPRYQDDKLRSHKIFADSREIKTNSTDLIEIERRINNE